MRPSCFEATGDGSEHDGHGEASDQVPSSGFTPACGLRDDARHRGRTGLGNHSDSRHRLDVEAARPLRSGPGTRAALGFMTRAPPTPRRPATKGGAPHHTEYDEQAAEDERHETGRLTSEAELVGGEWRESCRRWT